MACALPAEAGVPISRFSCSELRREVINRGLVAEISGTTIWRWLHQDALRPWSRRSWIFPRDPLFAEKATAVLDLYARHWQGQPLAPTDFVLCADEKTGLQIRQRIHVSQPPAPGRPLRVEHEYRRRGTCAYHAAWDVHHARLYGHVVERSTIEAFDRLVQTVMAKEPYRSASRVFWVVDNGTIHRGDRAVTRLRSQHPRLRLVHLPTHASWLNQIEIYFSILSRKALDPDDFASLEDLTQRVLRFQHHYQAIAKPFEWRFTRNDLHHLLRNLNVPKLAA